MSLFTFITNTDKLLPVLERIASALERIAPLPEEPVELKPEEAVSYVDEERIAQMELAEEMHKLQEWLDAHPEEQAEADVRSESD